MWDKKKQERRYKLNQSTLSNILSDFKKAKGITPNWKEWLESQIKDSLKVILKCFFNLFFELLYPCDFK